MSAETLEKIIAVDGGIRNWMERFNIEYSSVEGLEYLRNLVRNKKIVLTNDLRDQLVQIGNEIIDQRADSISKRTSGHNDSDNNI